MDVLGAIEAEEEGSSSTPEKEDAEDGKTVSVVQIFYSPIKQSVAPDATNPSLELAQVPPRDESLVVVEESVRDAGVSRHPGLRKKYESLLLQRRQNELLLLCKHSMILRRITSD